MTEAAQAYAQILASLKAEGRLRTLDHGNAAGLLDCTDNDYMGLGRDTAATQRFLRSLIDVGGGEKERREIEMVSCYGEKGEAEALMGSLASRLLMSRQDAYTSFECDLESEYGRPALIFNSGYHANTGCVAALAIPGTLIVADKLVHASIIDGIFLSKAPFKRFRHNDLTSLRKILDTEAGSYDRVLVIAESIYSMDGDCAPLRELAALKEQYPGMMLYIDEAHGFGVRGERGLGLCEETGILAQVDCLIGTLGKAAASSGAFAILSPLLKEYMINAARSFIFSTALPPVSVIWSASRFRRLTGMRAEREHLRKIAARLKAGVEEVTGETCVSDSQILPVMCGSSEKAVRLSEAMRRHGVLALPIRRPTVPPGTERLRISLNAAMTEADIDKILSALKNSWHEV